MLSLVELVSSRITVRLPRGTWGGRKVFRRILAGNYVKGDGEITSNRVEGDQILLQKKHKRLISYT